MTKCANLLTTTAVMLLSTTLVACGGGGGGNSSGGGAPVVVAPPPPPPPTTQAPTFTQAVFAPRADFVAQCEAPRAGNDPDGNPFPDTAGSTLIEKFWLRSWSNETYLWNDEIQDRDPNSIADNR